MDSKEAAQNLAQQEANPARTDPRPVGATNDNRPVLPGDSSSCAYLH